MGEDRRLKGIRGGRLKELMKGFFRGMSGKVVQRDVETTSNKPVEAAEASFKELIENHP